MPDEDEPDPIKDPDGYWEHCIGRALDKLVAQKEKDEAAGVAFFLPRGLTTDQVIAEVRRIAKDADLKDARNRGQNKAPPGQEGGRA